MSGPPTAAGELRELIREAHGLLKDMRAERRAIEGLLDGITLRVDARVEAAVRDSMDDLARATRAAMDKATDKVAREFDRLESLFLGTDRRSVRAGKPSIEDRIRSRAGADDG